MAVTKILARRARLDLGIRYILNGDKTEEHTLTAHLNCDPGRECRQMLDTKRAAGSYGKMDGVQYGDGPGLLRPERLGHRLSRKKIARISQHLFKNTAGNPSNTPRPVLLP